MDSPSEDPPLSLDEISQVVVDNINSICARPETTITCPFCSVQIRDKPETWTLALAHFIDAHTLHIERFTKISDVEEYD